MVTLNELLLPAADDLADRIKDALAQKGVSAKGDLEKYPMFGWKMMAEALGRRLGELLDIKIIDILVGAWNKSFTLRQQMDKSRATPGKDVFVQLSEHKITSTHVPYIALMKNGQEIKRLRFPVAVEIVLQGAVVRIRDGGIQEVQTGKVKVKGTVKCETVLLAQKELQPIAIPGTFQVAGTPAAAWLGPREERRAS
jgi:hypothetical protein